jgi:APA family basic amino acid/polyamine antiporter
VIGAIIGVGIFFTPARVAELSGSGGVALLAWGVGAAIALAGALTFAELGGLYPRTAAQYEVLRDAYGPLAGFLFVFCNATAIQGGAIAVIGLVCAEHLAIAAGGHAAGPAVSLCMALLLIAGLAAANVLGMRLGSGIQNLTAAARLATLLAVAIIAAAWGTADPYAAAAPAATGPERGILSAICAALVPAFFALGGWQQALWVAGEIRAPQRNVPLALVAGVVVVGAAYLLVNWAYLKLLGCQGVAASQALAADAVGSVWPTLGRRAAAAAVAVSALGVLNAQLLSGPRLIYGLAVDGRFFNLFARVHPRFGTPSLAVLLLAGLAIALLTVAGSEAFGRLVTGVVFVDGVFFALTGIALFVLRRNQPQQPRPVRVPGYPLVPLFFVAGEAGILMGACSDAPAREAAMVGLAWIAAGAVLYTFVFRRARSTPGMKEN